MKDRRATQMSKWRRQHLGWEPGCSERPEAREGYLLGLLQVPAGLMECLFGCSRGVAHSFQMVNVLQAASFLFSFLLLYLVQFLLENSKVTLGIVIL